METAAGPRRKTLEELVEGLMDALTFKEETETAEPGAARSIHEARRLRQAGDVDGALAVLAEVDTASAETNQARWAFSEWKQLVKRRHGDRDVGGLQPRHRQGRRAGAPRRRDAGGRGGLGGCAGGPERSSRPAACGDSGLCVEVRDGNRQRDG